MRKKIIGPRLRTNPKKGTNSIVAFYINGDKRIYLGEYDDDASPRSAYDRFLISGDRFLKRPGGPRKSLKIEPKRNVRFGEHPRVVMMREVWSRIKDN